MSGVFSYFFPAFTYCFPKNPATIKELVVKERMDSSTLHPSKIKIAIASYRVYTPVASDVKHLYSVRYILV